MSNDNDLRGCGFWYDCATRRYVTIHDHAVAAAADPARFRVKPRDVRCVYNAGTAGPAFEKARAKVIPKVAAQGFIRVRYIPRRGTLGFEFSLAACLRHGVNPYAVLGQFCRKHEVGPAVAVTVTDFDHKHVLTCPWSAVALCTRAQRRDREAALRLLQRWAGLSLAALVRATRCAPRRGVLSQPAAANVLADLRTIEAVAVYGASRVATITPFGARYLDALHREAPRARRSA